MRLTFLENIIENIPLEHRKHLHQRLRRFLRPAWLGTLRRTTPLSDRYGYDRGTPVDRYYIERFLQEHRRDIQGRVLEVKDRGYTERYGTDVKWCDVLDMDPNNGQATIIADLTAADAISANTFDCFILTQTLQLIYDIRAAISHAHRILHPGGVLLVTVPSVSRVVPDYGPKSDCWRFTAASCASLLGKVFGPEQVSVQSYGNVLTAIAFLTGMAYEELSRRELEANDEFFPVIIAVRAVKQCKGQQAGGRV
jgi:SAM-dependent methyltransferase